MTNKIEKNYNNPYNVPYKVDKIIVNYIIDIEIKKQSCKKEAIALSSATTPFVSNHSATTEILC